MQFVAQLFLMNFDTWYILSFNIIQLYSGNRRAGKAGELREVGGNLGYRERGGQEAPPQAPPHLPAAVHQGDRRVARDAGGEEQGRSLLLRSAGLSFALVVE